MDPSSNGPSRSPGGSPLSSEEAEQRRAKELQLQRLMQQIARLEAEIEHSAPSTPDASNVTTFGTPLAEQEQVVDVKKSESRNGLLLVLMGLEGSGRSFIAARLSKWLNWKGIRSCIVRADDDGLKNDEAVEVLKAFFSEHAGSVGIFMPWSCRVADRKALIEKISPEVLPKERVIFIESVCNDPDVLRQNVQGCGDHTDEEMPGVMAAVTDMQREQRMTYETLSEATDSLLSWVQLINVSQGHRGGKIRINRVQGHLPQRLLFFLLNLHPICTTLYLTRTGECQHQKQGKVGGDSELTEKGWQFAVALRQFFNLPQQSKHHLQVWTSTRRRARETGSLFQGSRFSVVHYKCLDDINAGECDGMSISKIQNSEKFKDAFEKRKDDKYRYGWPRGESYYRMNARLEQIILDIHQTGDPVLIISHVDVCRGLYAYLTELRPEGCVHLDIPQHCVFEINCRIDIEKGSGEEISVVVHDLTHLVDQAAEEGIGRENLPPETLLRVPATPPPTDTHTPPHLLLPAHIREATSSTAAFRTPSSLHHVPMHRTIPTCTGMGRPADCS